MESMCAKFWWGQRGNERKIHWNRWKDLCRPKSHGGIGFRDFEDFNTALLGKHLWRFVNNESSITLVQDLEGTILPNNVSLGGLGFTRILS